MTGYPDKPYIGSVMTMTKTELLAGILDLVSQATDKPPGDLRLTAALDMLYAQFTSYLLVVEDTTIKSD